MPVSEPEKSGVFVPGYHFSEKAEHIPIKKRRILFRPSSPPNDTTNSPPEDAERHETSPKLNSDASSVPATCETVTGICERGSEDHKPDKKELVKDSDISDTSILAAAAACSNSLVAEADRCEGSVMVSSVTETHGVEKTVEFNEKIVKKEPDCHRSPTPSKVVESTLNNSSSHVPLELALSNTNQEPNIQKSPARDVKFNWDLNTVMDACEEPFVSEHDISNDKAKYVEEKKKCMEVTFEGQSKNIINENIPELNSFAHENRKSKVEKREPLSDKIDSFRRAVAVKTEILDNNHTDRASDAIPVSKTLSLENPVNGIVSKHANVAGQIPSKSNINRNSPIELNNLGYAFKVKMEKCEPLSHKFDNAQPLVVKTESLHNKHTDNASNVIPVSTTLSLENLTHSISSKCANLCGQSSISGGFDSSTQAVDTKLSIDGSIPASFDRDHPFKSHISKEILSPTTQTVIGKHDSSRYAATCVENGRRQSAVTPSKVEDEAMTKSEKTSNVVGIEGLVNKDENDKKGSKVVMEDQPAAVSSTHDANNLLRYYDSQSHNKVVGAMSKREENSVVYDSQFEDGELRDGTKNAWKGYELTEYENEYDMNRGHSLDMSISDAYETNSQHGQEGSSGITKLTEVGSVKEADVTSSVAMPEKLQSSGNVLSSSEPNVMTTGQEIRERQDNLEQHASQSDEWKMNVSGRELFPESQRILSNNFSKPRNFTGRKFSYRLEEKDRLDTEDMEVKAVGPRFHRNESLTRLGGSSARDLFLTRGRLQMQGCSSEEGEGLTYRPERESGALRSFGRGRYSPPNRPSGREGGLWRRSLERGRVLNRSIPEDSETTDHIKSCMDSSDVGRHNISSYISRRPYRSKSPATQEVNDFRARLGLRPTEDTGNEKYVNLSRGRGRGRSMRYDTRLDREGPRGRYYGPTSDDCDDLMTEYSHPFPRRHRCLSPIERGGISSYKHFQSGSRSPPRPRTRSPVVSSSFRHRSRSPGFRPDVRIPRPRSPGYPDHSSEYNSGPRNSNSSPPSSRWVSFKERPVFNRSPPPGRTDGPQVDRFSFYDSSRNPKQNEYYRSWHPGKFSDLNEGGRGRPRYVDDEGDRLNNGYRRSGFVRRYNMDEPAKRFQHDAEDRCSRGGTDSRFRDVNTLQ